MIRIRRKTLLKIAVQSKPTKMPGATCDRQTAVTLIFMAGHRRMSVDIDLRFRLTAVKLPKKNAK